MKTHWLYGRGPDKVLVFEHEIDVEADCTKCVHRKVCDYKMDKRCENYTFGTSQFSGCQGCLHKYTRWDKDAVPCFSCPYFQEGTPAEPEPRE